MPAAAVLVRARSSRPDDSFLSIQLTYRRPEEQCFSVCSSGAAFKSLAASGEPGVPITSVDSAFAMKSTSARGSHAGMGVEEASNELPDDPIPLKGIAELADSGQYKVSGHHH